MGTKRRSGGAVQILNLETASGNTRFAVFDTHPLIYIFYRRKTCTNLYYGIIMCALEFVCTGYHNNTYRFLCVFVTVYPVFYVCAAWIRDDGGESPGLWIMRWTLWIRIYAAIVGGTRQQQHTELPIRPIRLYVHSIFYNIFIGSCDLWIFDGRNICFVFARIAHG